MRKLRGYRGRGKREREEGPQTEETDGETNRPQREETQEKRQRTERSESKMELEAAGETGQSSSQSRRKKDNKTNILLTDSEEVIADFLNDHNDGYDQTNELFKNKARKESLLKSFTRRHKLFVQTCKTWLKSQRTLCGKFTETKSGQAPQVLTDRQQWIQDRFQF